MDRTAKKHLMAIPVQSYTGDDTFARVYAEKDILMLHLWNDGKFKGRHLVDKTGKYVAEIDGVMHIKRLRNQICDSSSHMYGWPDMRVSEEDEKTVHAFFEEYNDIGLLINQAESQYSKDQYSRKMDRKIDRINAKMALFEEQEEKIKEWYLREITPWEYAFKADGVYYCTACGETHTGGYKHLQRFKCSGKMVTVMTRTKVKEKSDWVTAFSRQADGSLAERLYKISILWSRNEKMVDIKETIRWVWMPYQPGKVYYRQWGETWWDTNPCNRRWDASYLYPEQAEEVLRKSGYEATQLWDIGKAELPINWIMKRKTPVYAQLCLTGLAKLAPTGTGMAMVRVEGRGKLMLSVEEKEITITNVRTQLQTQYTPGEMVREIRVLCPIDKTPEQAWFSLYGRPLEQSEPEPPKQVEILTKGKPPKVAPSERKSERKPEKPERTTPKPEKNTEKRERSPQKPEKIPQKHERLPGKDKLEEIAPAQEWLDRMRECFERALQAAEEGRWIAWEGHMLQAKNVANVMRKAQEDREIPGQMSMEMD